MADSGPIYPVGGKLFDSFKIARAADELAAAVASCGLAG
jgi:hypothetical protein